MSGEYDVLVKFGALLLKVQPWLIIILIAYLVAAGIWIAVSEKGRSMSKELFIGGAVGIAIAFGAGPIGQSLAGVFQLSAIITRFIL